MLNFPKRLVINGTEWNNNPLKFDVNCIQCNGSTPSWQDIILSGNTALTLVNAKANGLNYVKLFGACEQNGTPSPDTPVDIVSNNGVLKLSPNLVDFNEIRINRTTWASADKTKGFEVNADVYNKSVGDQLFTNANCFGVFVPAKINESVSLEFFDYSPDYTRCYYCEVTADGKCNTAPVSFASDGAISQQTFTLTQTDSIGFVFEWYISGARVRNYTKENYMIVRGATPPTAYMPYGQIYTDGTVETIAIKDDQDTTVSTATCEDLLSIGTYTDEQEIISGVVTRKVGVKVLDGTEAWVPAGTGAAADYLVALTKNQFASDIDTSATYNSFLCSHLKMGNNDAENTLSITAATFGVRLGLNTDITGTEGGATKLANAKQYLADQYAAGTPVIVVYPLAEPTTETVAGQALTTQAGTNIVEITQASIDNLALEVSYKGKQ